MVQHQRKLDPFANTGNLKFAVANDDEGYKSDLIPVKISIGDQVVNTLRANDQMDWTFTTKKRPSTAPNPANTMQQW